MFNLEEVLEKYFKTSFIGNLSIFEENFGSLWGHGKPYNELNASEKAMREVWKDTRTKILDTSNKQLRLCVEFLGE